MVLTKGAVPKSDFSFAQWERREKDDDVWTRHTRQLRQLIQRLRSPPARRGRKAAGAMAQWARQNRKLWQQAMGGAKPDDDQAAIEQTVKALGTAIQGCKNERVKCWRKRLQADGLGKTTAAWIRNAVSNYHNVAVEDDTKKDPDDDGTTPTNYFSQDAVERIRDHYEQHFTDCG